MASKPGRRRVFIDDALAALLRGKYPTQRQALRVTSEKGSAPWATVNEAQSGGSISRRQQTSEYEEVLKQGTRPKATAEEDKAKLRWLDQHLGGKELDTINRDMIERITQAKLADQCSNATLNRTLALVRSTLRKCVRDWQWLDRASSVRMLKEEPTRRIRYLTHSEADRLLAELPQHLRDMATFSLASGLRDANVTGLCWSAVNLDRRLAWVHPDEAKARKTRPVPLNGEAISILQKQIGKHQEVVFTFKGKRVEQVSTSAWHKALGRAGIDNFRWHDLRHT